MKLFKIILLILLFCCAHLFLSAQALQITEGSVVVTSNPYTIPGATTNLSFSISHDVFAHLITNGWNAAALPFSTGRPISGYVHTFAPTPEALGAVYTCQGRLAHPEQPLSTQFEMKLADFRIPNYPKLPPSPTYFVEVIVPFTMTGRLSCMGDKGQISQTFEISGTGNARLRFKRVDTIFRRVYLTYAYYGFGTSAP